MSQVIKLQESELERIKSTQGDITNLTYSLGQLEIQKSSILVEIDKVQARQNELGKELNDKYGEGNINLETGELTLTEPSK
jgi:seryl-tRNA synthetase